MAGKAFWGTMAGGAAAAAVAGAIAFAVPAAAATSEQAVTAGQTVSVASTAKPDTAVACDRLTKHEQRRQAALTRLQGDANTKGSIANVTARAAAATTSGDTARAKLYTDKAALRTALLDPLQKVEADLAAVIKASCG